jgi:acyl-[acyl-carrier-protein]-phospholipid O-acyltransferase/long-chain-fatty-acid--[acyl-carrier-protein] ligase
MDAVTSTSGVTARPGTPTRLGAYLYTQFFSAFNDNVHFFTVALYLAYSASRTPAEAGRWQAIAGGTFVLPFILLSPFAGALADRYPKRTVLIWAKWTEVLPMTLSFGSTFLPVPLRYYGLILGILLMETRAAFFSPPKYGILPEIVAPDRLVRANGILQMLTMVAIVSGEAIAGTSLHHLGIQTTIGGCLLLSILGSLLVTRIPHGAAGDPKHPLKVNPLSGIWGTLREMRSDRVLLVTVFTLSAFWLVSGLFRSNMPLFGKIELGVTEDKSSYLMAFVSVGIGAGAALASLIRGSDRSMGLVLPGVAGMSLAAIGVALLGHRFLPSGLMLSILGVFGGFYLVPQTTIFQARSPAERRGAYLGVQNFFAFTFMLIAAILFDLLTNLLRLSPRAVFLTVGAGLVGLGIIQTLLQPSLLLGQFRTLVGRSGPVKGEVVA